MYKRQIKGCKLGDTGRFNKAGYIIRSKLNSRNLPSNFLSINIYLSSLSPVHNRSRIFLSVNWIWKSIQRIIYLERMKYSIAAFKCIIDTIYENLRVFLNQKRLVFILFLYLVPDVYKRQELLLSNKKGRIDYNLYDLYSQWLFINNLTPLLYNASIFFSSVIYRIKLLWYWFFFYRIKSCNNINSIFFKKT